MLNLLNTGTISRSFYIVCVIAFVAFDFAKPPLSKYLMGLKETVQQDIYAADAPALRQGFGSVAAPVDESLSEADRTQLAQEKLDTLASTAAQAIASDAKASAIGSIFISLLTAIGFASLVAMIWLILARLRDIGWPPAIGWAIIALPLLPRLLGAGNVPDFVWYGANYLFFAAAAGLALVPGQYDAPVAAEPVPAAAPRANSDRPAQFGRRGL